MDDMVPTLATGGVADDNTNDEIRAAYDRMVFLLERLVEIQSGYPGIQQSILRVPNSNTAVPFSYHNRMRVTGIIISNWGSLNTVFTLKVGTGDYKFGSPLTHGNDYLPFPLVVENGVDVSYLADDDSQNAMYFVYTTE